MSHATHHGSKRGFGRDPRGAHPFLRPLMLVDAAAIAVLLGVTVIAYLGGVRPALDARDADRQLRADLEAQASALADLTATRRDFERRLDDARRIASERHVRLELASYLNSRLAGLTEFAADTGLAIAGMESREAPPDPRWTRVSVRVTGQGSYHACTRFLARVHTSFADTEVTGFSLSGNPEDPATSASFVFDLVWYAAPADGAAP